MVKIHATLILCALIAHILPTQVTAEEDVLLKFNGRDLTGFYTFMGTSREDPHGVFSVTDDGQLLISGEHRGYLSTEKPLENYRLVAEFKWGGDDAKADSGIFFNAVPADKLWAKSHEFQMRQGATGDLCLIGGANLTADKKEWNRGCIARPGKQAGIDPEKPKGEWNKIEIVSAQGRVTMKLNGMLLTEGTAPSPSSGRVYFQSFRGPLLYKSIVFTRVAK